MLLQCLADEAEPGIDDRGAERTRTAEALRFNGATDGVGMDSEFASDGADFPVLGVKVPANLGVSFGADHDEPSPPVWNARKRIDKASGSSANPATEPRADSYLPERR